MCTHQLSTDFRRIAFESSVVLDTEEVSDIGSLTQASNNIHTRRQGKGEAVQSTRLLLFLPFLAAPSSFGRLVSSLKTSLAYTARI